MMTRGNEMSQNSLMKLGILVLFKLNLKKKTKEASSGDQCKSREFRGIGVSSLGGVHGRAPATYAFQVFYYCQINSAASESETCFLLDKATKDTPCLRIPQNRGGTYAPLCLNVSAAYDGCCTPLPYYSITGVIQMFR